MKLINGVFKDDNGNIIPLQFGNEHQINLIKKLEIINENIKKGYALDITTDTTYIFKSSFSCVCGSNIFLEDDSEDEDDAVWKLSGYKKTCRICGKKYETFNINGELIVKFDEDKITK